MERTSRSSRRCPGATCAGVLRDLASGLALLHARRLVHRDVSARNAWLLPDGRANSSTSGRWRRSAGAMTSRERPRSSRRVAAGSRPRSAHRPLLARLLGVFPAHRSPRLRGAVARGAWSRCGRNARGLLRGASRSSSGRTCQACPRRSRPSWRACSADDPLARPTTAADVIDRLQVIASLESDAPSRVLESYLTSPLFVGRTAERDTLRAAFSGAVSGRAASAIVEGPSGLGRTRLLQEVALEARVAGAVVLHAEPLFIAGPWASRTSSRCACSPPCPSRRLPPPHPMRGPRARVADPPRPAQAVGRAARRDAATAR